jgi:transposase
VGKIAYSGEKVFIGIDVHVRKYAVTCVTGGSVVKRATLNGDPDTLVKFIKKYFEGADVRTAYEAGFSGFTLHRKLEGAGINNMVVNAASIEVAARDRVKTDKRDSLKLADQLEKGRLRGIRVPSLEEEARRVLHRTREQVSKKKRACMVQIRMRLHQFGIEVCKPKQVVTLSAVEECLKTYAELPREVVLGIRVLMNVWKALLTEMKVLSAELKRQAASDPLESTYRSAPGIGPLSARVLSTELGDMKQFPNERAIFSFTGLTPGEHSSGDGKNKQRRGHISRQGSGRLRHVLVEAAWNAVGDDEKLRATFQQLAARVGKKRAIVAIARRLIGRIRALFRKGELYRTPLPLAA